ncbi:MAG: helix-turn-helix domain-containing protein [Micrococcales bacterium]|nr:helix-turn-helix domain-containing protein [Micrococcales bacterium]
MIESFMDTEQSDFGPIDDTFAALKAVPGIDDDLDDRIEAREQMEREHIAGLAMVREVAAMTQDDVAKKMGVAQGSVSRLERRGDLLLSSLRAYFQAVGAEATIVLKIGDTQRFIPLDDLVVPRRRTTDA